MSGERDGGARPVPERAPLDRRAFLLWASEASLSATALFLVGTGVRALMPPARGIDGMSDVGPMTVARLSDLAVGTPTLVDYGDDRVFVLRTSRTDVVAFDAACPHARCTLRFNAPAGTFDCPCHASRFTRGGERISGPATRGMTHADVRIEGERVIVTGFRA